MCQVGFVIVCLKLRIMCQMITNFTLKHNNETWALDMFLEFWNLCSMTIFHFCHQILSNLHRRFGTHSLWGFGPGMKGMGQVAAGSTRLIQHGNVLISEMESLGKRNLLPWCLPAASA